MKPVIKQIDRALKDLYLLSTPFNAEDFLLARPIQSPSIIANAHLRGALYVRPDSEELSLGIYLSPKISKELKRFFRWQKRDWTHSQLEAFTVATEEVTHFQYLLSRAQRKCSVTQFELELQAEVDKFVLSFFAGEVQSIDRFSSLLERLFIKFRLSDTLSPEERDRYLEANRISFRFIKQLETLLASPSSNASALKKLRSFYHSSVSEKIRMG